MGSCLHGIPIPVCAQLYTKHLAWLQHCIWHSICVHFVTDWVSYCFMLHDGAQNHCCSVCCHICCSPCCGNQNICNSSNCVQDIAKLSRIFPVVVPEYSYIHGSIIYG